MWYLSIFILLLPTDDDRHAPGLEKQTGVTAQEQSNALLWIGTSV